MLIRQFTVVAYLSLAFWAIGMVLVVLAARWPGLPPAGVALVGLMADYVLVKAWEPWRAVSVGARLLEGASAHGGINLLIGPRAAAFLLVLGVTIGAGLLVVRRLDL